MQPTLSTLMDDAIAADDDKSIRPQCAQYLATEGQALAWQPIHQAAVDIFLQRIEFPAVPNVPLTKRSLATFLKDVADMFPDSDDEEEEEEEEDSSFVESDDVGYDNKKRRL